MRSGYDPEGRISDRDRELADIAFEAWLRGEGARRGDYLTAVARWYLVTTPRTDGPGRLRLVTTSRGTVAVRRRTR